MYRFSLSVRVADAVRAPGNMSKHEAVFGKAELIGAKSVAEIAAAGGCCVAGLLS